MLRLALLCSLLACSSPAQTSSAGPNPQELVDRYCVLCHSSAAKAGGLVLQGLAPGASDHAQVWEKVIKKVTSGEMPPAGIPRPSADALNGFTGELVSKLDAAAAAHPYVGQSVVRRLNRTEYTHAIRDLLSLDLPLESDLPPDGLEAGFDNIGDALSLSPVLIERYLKTARKIGNLATGTADPDPVTAEYPATGPQGKWLGPDAPFGTRGGVSVHHFFPAEGDYDLRAFLGSLRGNLMTPVEGVRFFQLRTHVTAGSHHFVVTFPQQFAQREDVVPNLSGPGGPAAGGPSDILNSAIRPTLDFLMDGRRLKLFEIHGPTPAEAVTGYEAGPLMLKKVEITGPFHPTGAAETVSRQRIFTCHPQLPSEENACATKILSALARRAYRRNVTTEDVQPLLATYTRARAKVSGANGFDRGIAAALADILVSPDFLFRLEFDPPGLAAGTAYRVNGFALASRLSFFLWNTIPDDQLLNAAQANALATNPGLEAEVHRMLADPKAEELTNDFAAQWLGLRDPVATKPDALLYPDFDSALLADFEEESRLFVRSVLRGGGSVLDLVNADYSYLNERLAKVYGIPGVTGPGFRRVSLKDNPQRGGILGEGYILLMTSHNNRTSPILRGKWILQNLLNAAPPPPPPGIPALDEVAKNGKVLTTRQQVEMHRANAVCASCHTRMDPLGFALENYDVVGKWRVRDAGGPIDPSGKLPSGETINGLASLHEYFNRHSEQFVTALVERLMTYALGRQLDARDQPAVRKIVRDAQPRNYRFSDLILGIVNSPAFQMRRTQESS